MVNNASANKLHGNYPPCFAAPIVAKPLRGSGEAESRRLVLVQFVEDIGPITNTSGKPSVTVAATYHSTSCRVFSPAAMSQTPSHKDAHHLEVIFQRLDKTRRTTRATQKPNRIAQSGTSSIPGRSSGRSRQRRRYRRLKS